MSAKNKKREKTIKKIAKIRANLSANCTSEQRQTYQESARILVKSRKMDKEIRSKGSSKNPAERPELEKSFMNRMKDAPKIKIKKSDPDY